MNCGRFSLLLYIFPRSLRSSRLRFGKPDFLVFVWAEEVFRNVGI